MLTGQVAVWLSSLVFFVAFYAVTVPAAQIIMASGHHGWQAGAILGAFGVAALAGRPLSGRAVDRFGARRVALAGGFLAAAGGALFGLSGEAWLMTVARVIQALGYVAFSTAVTAMAGSLAHARTRAVALARSATAGNIAVGVAPGLAQVSGQLGIIFSLAAALSVVGGVIACFAVPRAGERDRVEATAPALPELRSPRRLAPFAGALLAGFTFAAFMQFGGMAAGEHAGGLFAVYGAVIVAIRLGYPSGQGAAGAPARAFLILACGLPLLAIPAAWPAAGVAIAAGFALLYPSLMAQHIGLRPDRERGRAVATYYLFSDAGFALGSWLLPVVLQIGGTAGLFGAAAAGACAGATVFLPGWLGRPRIASSSAPLREPLPGS